MRLVALCVVGGLVMLAAARAHADWRTDVSVKERPNDVLEVWGPERFSLGYVGGESGAYLFVDGGVARKISHGGSAFESAGTYYQQPEDCFVSVSKEVGTGGVRTGLGADGGTCGPVFPLITSGSTD
ncbi:hypothetical protein, partial [Archangium sp.]|uniref:hypothetical protein n=1 Tax=Archangium sp. TaxID=1872627 RepID=UPI002D6A517D